MEHNKHVLLVTNTVSEAEVAQIKEAVTTPQILPVPIKLSLVHVIPTLPTCYFNIPSMIVLADRYYQEARENLARIGDTLNISKRDQWLIMGKVRTEVLRLANKINVNFILANSAHLTELRKSPLIKKENQRVIINHLSELCAE